MRPSSTREVDVGDDAGLLVRLGPQAVGEHAGGPNLGEDLLVHQPLERLRVLFVDLIWIVAGDRRPGDVQEHVRVLGHEVGSLFGAHRVVGR